MRTALLLAWLIGAPSAVRALAAGLAEPPVLREQSTAGRYQLEGRFEVGATPHQVWEVLSDYDRLPRFVPSIRTSASHPLSDGGLVVDQEFEGKVLIFSRDVHVRLEINVEPEHRITFRDLEARDFDFYAGSWEVTPTPSGSLVVYRLNAKPHEAVPEVVLRGVFKDAALQMLVRLRQEMIRRAQTWPVSLPRTFPP